jgi:hypothetical protein
VFCARGAFILIWENFTARVLCILLKQHGSEAWHSFAEHGNALRVNQKSVDMQPASQLASKFSIHSTKARRVVYNALAPLALTAVSGIVTHTPLFTTRGLFLEKDGANLASATQI